MQRLVLTMWLFGFILDAIFAVISGSVSCGGVTSSVFKILWSRLAAFCLCGSWCRHEHLPTGLGVISSPTDLPSTGEVSPPHTILASTTTTSASTTTTSQPHPTYVLRSTTSASPSAPELSSVRLRPPSADLAPSPSFDLNSPTCQSCPPLADLASFPPLGSSS